MFSSQESQMSSGYKGLDDILTALRNTSVLGLPSGEYLMCFCPIYYFKLNGTRLSIALSLAELHTCFSVASVTGHNCNVLSPMCILRAAAACSHHQPSSDSQGRNK